MRGLQDSSGALAPMRKEAWSGSKGRRVITYDSKGSRRTSQRRRMRRVLKDKQEFTRQKMREMRSKERESHMQRQGSTEFRVR